MRAKLPLLVCLALAACYDFTDPDFPEAGAPAVIQASFFRDERPKIVMQGQLVPGLTEGGIVRTVANDSLEFSGLRVGPIGLKPNGTREYSTIALPLASRTQPLDFRAPRILEIAGTPPHWVWYPIRKTDADTIAMKRGADLTLHVDTAVGISTPTPPIRQWFLELQGNPTFRISSDGPPPPSLHVPAEWVPRVNGQMMTIVLSYYQAGQVSTPANDYIGNISQTTLIQWVVRITEP